MKRLSTSSYSIWSSSSYHHHSTSSSLKLKRSSRYLSSQDNNNNLKPLPDLSNYPPQRIRNACIVAHIDHGKL
jgi:hypothetical protein